MIVWSDSGGGDWKQGQVLVPNSGVIPRLHIKIFTLLRRSYVGWVGGVQSMKDFVPGIWVGGYLASYLD